MQVRLVKVEVVTNFPLSSFSAGRSMTGCGGADNGNRVGAGGPGARDGRGCDFVDRTPTTNPHFAFSRSTRSSVQLLIGTPRVRSAKTRRPAADVSSNMLRIQTAYRLGIYSYAVFNVSTRLTTDCSALPRVRNWPSTVRVFSAAMAVSPSSSPLLLEGSAIMADAIAVVVSSSLQRKRLKKRAPGLSPQSSFQFFSSY